MIEPLKFILEGKPVPWQWATPVKLGDNVVSLTPKATRAFQKMLRRFAQLSMGSRPPMTGPIEMLVTAYMARPATVTRSLPWKQGTGDADNYAKSAQDALNGVAFIDDAQICDLIGRKRYGTPRLEIEIRSMGDED